MKNTVGKLIVEKVGGPEVMQWIQEELPEPSFNEALVRHEAIGVDFIDTQLRSGTMPASLPTGLGFAAVGVLEKIGETVEGLRPGDRVAYIYSVPGAYAEARNVPAERLFKLPDQDMSPEEAAGALFRGITSWYLATRLRDVRPGDYVLVHAAAGGVGLILTQWLTQLGAIVIGTTGGANKVQVLRDYGCLHPIDMDSQDFSEEVKRITNDQGVAIVYDSIGKTTFDRSLRCLQRFGLMVSYGWVSGDVDPIALSALRNLGSLFITRPTVSHYTADPADFKQGAAALYGMMANGHIKIKTDHRYPLRNAAQAHCDLAAKKTTGSVILIP